MSDSVKLRPDQPARHYLGIDVTGTLDSTAWGQAWNARFGWKNLLLQLDRDPADPSRRIDKAHLKLPIRRRTSSRTLKSGQVHYADTILLPEGVDKGDHSTGTDPLWPSPNFALNIVEISDACTFTRSFILSPHADQTSSTLHATPGGSGVVADIIYVSSHGLMLGDMMGDIGLTLFGAAQVFRLAQAAAAGASFSGVGWLLLSNCNTLVTSTHGDWQALMSNGSPPLRGVVGFQDLCPLPAGSADVFTSFINQLAAGKTFVEAWRTAMTGAGMSKAWVVLCHENAVNDTIVDWNADKLKAIPTSGSKVLFFDDANRPPAGKAVAALVDHFDAFWSKGGTRVQPSNIDDPAMVLKPGEIVTITVRLPDPARNPGTPTTFPAGSVLTVTVVYIRLDYEQEIDLGALFEVPTVTNATLQSPATAKKNAKRPRGFDKTDDSWLLNVTGTPKEVVLSVKCKSITHLKHHNIPLWLQVSFGSEIQNTIRNGAIKVG